MSRRYIYKRNPTDRFGDPVRYARFVLALGRAVVAGKGLFTIEQDGERVSRKLQRLEVLKRLPKLVAGVGIGPTFKVFDGKGRVVFACRSVSLLDQTNSTNGNLHADEYFNWVKATYRQFDPRYAGAYVCKNVAGSSTRSQHSYGNAVDFFFDSMDDQTKVYIAVKAGLCPVPVAHAISGDNIWEPNVGQSHYTGEYHSHLHVDFVPQFSGRCGVREP